jgi:hypothetical protein
MNLSAIALIIGLVMLVCGTYVEYVTGKQLMGAQKRMDYTTFHKKMQSSGFRQRYNAAGVIKALGIILALLGALTL